MEFVQRKEVLLHQIKVDKQIIQSNYFLYILSFLLIGFYIYVAFSPFKVDTGYASSNPFWTRIGFWISYHQPRNYSWGWLNYVAIGYALVCGLLLFIIYYISFFKANRRVLNNWGYASIFILLFVLIMTLICGELGFLSPHAFMYDQVDKTTILKMNINGYALFATAIVLFVFSFASYILWIIWIVKGWKLSVKELLKKNSLIRKNKKV